MNRAKPRVTTMLLERRARALRRHLAAGSDQLDIHQARVASRRLREAVPVLSTDLKGGKAGKARRKIRRVTRALGSIRELDVTVKILDELAARNTLPRTAIEEVRRHVITERERRAETMKKRLEQINLSKLDKRLAAVAGALQQTESEGWRDALASRLMKRSKALVAAVGEAGQMYAPERLHLVRIAAKKLRYALEIAADTGIKSASPLVRTIKRTQDNLGRLHDLQVLQSHVAAVQAGPSQRSLPDSGLDILGRALEDECRHLHARYVAAAPGLLEVADSIRRVVVQQIARPTRGRRRPLKMGLSGRPRRRRDAAGSLPRAASPRP